MIFDNWTIQINHPTAGLHTASNTIADNLVFSSTKNEEQRFFRTVQDQELRFIGADYEFLKAIDESGDRCEETTITFSSGTFSRTYLLSIVGAAFKNDLKEVILKPGVDDKYSCVVKSWEDEISIFDSPRIEVSLYYGIEVELNSQSYSNIADFPGIITPAPPPTTDATDPAWILLTLDATESSGFWSGNVTYARQKKVTDCVDGSPVAPPGNGWQLRTDDCAGSGTSTYTKTVPYVLDEEEEYINTDTRKRQYRKIPGYDLDELTGLDIDNGVSLMTVLSSWYNSKCGGVVVSDLFDFNAPGTAPSNDVYDQAENCANTLIFQISDIKRPDATENAKSGNITPKKILEGIWAQFQAIWWIDSDGDLRIEHNSILSTVSFMDLTSTHAEQIKGLNNYSSIQGDLPRNQTFDSSESYGHQDFTGTPLNYPNSCSEGADKYTTPWVTDMGSILVNPSLASDSGFVVVSALKDGSDYYVDTEEGEISGLQILNGAFSWANLQAVYHQHHRPFLTGVMNTRDHTFESAKKFKRQSLSIIMGLTDYLAFLVAIENPEADSGVTTQIGVGEVETARYDTKNQTLTLTLLHD